MQLTLFNSLKRHLRKKVSDRKSNEIINKPQILEIKVSLNPIKESNKKLIRP